MAKVDLYIEQGAHLLGETQLLSLEFLSLKNIQQAFEAEGEPKIDLKTLPKLKLKAFNHKKDEIIRTFNDLTVNINSSLGI